MSAKKKDIAAELQSGEHQKSAALCGHVNKQYYNTQGILEDLVCVLPAGHSGDHSASCQTLLKHQYAIKDPAKEYVVKNGAEYEVVTQEAFWGDAAGVSAADIRPDYEGMTREEWVASRRRKALEKPRA